MNNIEDLIKINVKDTKKLNEETNKINEKMYIKSTLYSKRGNEFYDISFVNDGVESFIGRYSRIDNKVEVFQNKDKILICNRKFIEDGMKIVKVLGMYNILDNMLYYCTELEALELFDSNIDKKYLKNPENTICRLDIEKKRRNEESIKKI